MKVFAKFAAIALAGTMAMSACKYEDGPRISLRSKRDRVANEWRIENLTYDGQDVTTSVNQTEGQFGNEFSVILSMYRTGSYGLNMVATVVDTVTGGKRYITTHIGNNSIFLKPNEMWNEIAINDYLNNLPKPLKEIMNAGTWAFEKGHYKIAINPDRAYDPNEVTTQKNPIFWVITMLKESEMHIRGNDDQGKEFTMKLKRLNDEAYFF